MVTVVGLGEREKTAKEEEDEKEERGGRRHCLGSLCGVADRKEKREGREWLLGFQSKGERRSGSGCGYDIICLGVFLEEKEKREKNRKIKRERDDKALTEKRKIKTKKEWEKEKGRQSKGCHVTGRKRERERLVLEEGETDDVGIVNV